MFRKYYSIFCLIISLSAFYGHGSAEAKRDVVYTYYPGGEERFTFHLDVLKMALDHSSLEYNLVRSKYQDITQSRAEMLVYENKELDVMWGPSDAAREQKLKLVPLPFDYGLLGYRVFVIKDEDQERFSSIKRLNQLIDYRPIQVEEWVDTDILRDAGFNVSTGPYKNLYTMLKWRRGDFIPRSVREVQEEFQKMTKDIQGLSIDQNILLRYREGDFFYVNQEDQELYDALKYGLKEVYQNGKLREYIFSHYGRDEDSILNHLQDRVMIRLFNSYVSDQVKGIPDKYFDIFLED